MRLKPIVISIPELRLQLPEVSPSQIARLRILMGIFIIFILIGIWPHRIELFGTTAPISWPTTDKFWELLAGELGSTFFFLTALAAAGAMVIGKFPKTCALILLLTLTYIRSFNNIIFRSPEFGFIGLGCFLVLLSPSRLDFNTGHHRPLNWIFFFAWVYLIAHYTHFGLMKIFAPNSGWVSGDALSYLLRHDFFRREWYTGLIDHVPEFVLKSLTWLSVGVEICAPLFFFQAKSRRVWNSAAILMNLGILTVLDILPVSLGMIAFHLALHEWPKRKV